MNELVTSSSPLPLWDVTLEHGQRKEQGVSARDLHTFLGLGRDFSSWMKDQIERAMLTEGEDYITVTKKGVEVINNLEGLRQGLDYTIEYYLTLDTAKHLAMLSGTVKGREARRYFLACERALIQQNRSSLEKQAAELESTARRAYLAGRLEGLSRRATEWAELDQAMRAIQKGLRGVVLPEPLIPEFESVPEGFFRESQVDFVARGFSKKEFIKVLRLSGVRSCRVKGRVYYCLSESELVYRALSVAGLVMGVK